ncbi:hypothetical protein BDZ90DRAFT_228670 [Jaminaea rosea]|uniref:Uncharacterized protein n=1 Tax=Jaminaea rosea TaxID=1569628 RepID=A0A316UKZ1_9BASI|nr:hypothetical protein BDZ90DRAFT_228670 [Jaminaea rosea]PWN25041.1 hypothetical protein BDZ90DRAFT_228670 [Jaminaea rosea]
MSALLLLLVRALIGFLAWLTFLFSIANIASWHKSVHDTAWCAEGIAHEEACKLPSKFIAAYAIAIVASTAFLAVGAFSVIGAIRSKAVGARSRCITLAATSIVVFILYIAFLALISANGKKYVVSMTSWEGYDNYLDSPGGGLGTSPNDEWSGSIIDNGGVVAPGMVAAILADRKLLRRLISPHLTLRDLHGGIVRRDERFPAGPEPDGPEQPESIVAWATRALLPEVVAIAFACLEFIIVCAAIDLTKIGRQSVHSEPLLARSTKITFQLKHNLASEQSKSSRFTSIDGCKPSSCPSSCGDAAN